MSALRTLAVLIPSRLQRELASQFLLMQLAVMLVATLIVTGGILGRVLGDVAEGRIPIDVLPWLVAFGTAKALVLLWPAGLFLAAVLLLGRWARDSEWVAMQACGQGEVRVLGGLMVVAIPVAFLLSVAMHGVLPAVERQVEQLRAEAQSRPDLAVITPGRFLESTTGNRVVFAERYAPGRDGLERVFLFAELPVPDGMPERWEVTVAQQARRIDREVDDMLELRDGERWEVSPGLAEAERLRFNRMRLPTPIPEVSTDRTSVDAMSSAELWAGRDDPRYRAEFEWRWTIPISVLVMLWAAVVISRVPPRSSRYRKLPWAILAYVVYANLLLAVKGWLGAGLVPPWSAIVWINVPVLVGLVLASAMGLRGAWSSRGSSRRARAAAPPR